MLQARMDLSFDLLSQIAEFLNFKDSVSLGTTCRTISKEGFYTRQYYKKRLNLEYPDKELIVRIGNGFQYYHPCELFNIRFFSDYTLMIQIRALGNKDIRMVFRSIHAFIYKIRDIPSACDYPKVVKNKKGQIGFLLGTYDPVSISGFIRGDYVDAVDDDGIWYEAQIVDRTRNEYTVHFRQWSSKFDIHVPIDSPRLAPSYIHVNNWRRSLAIGSDIHIKKSGRWYDASILHLDEDMLTFAYTSPFFKKEESINIDDDMIAPSDMHSYTNKKYRKDHHFTKKIYDMGSVPIIYNLTTKSIEKFDPFRPILDIDIP